MQKQSSSEPAALDPPEAPEDTTADQRRRIVDSMVSCCAEKTYAPTTIADIVARAGVSRTTFYKLFEDKRACFDAALDACIEEVRSAAGAAVLAADPPPEAVRKATAAVLDLLARSPQVAQVLVAEAVSVEPAILSRYRALLMPALTALLGARRRGATSPALALGRAHLLVLNQVAGGRANRLAELEPEIAYLALAPFLGHREAIEQARPATALGPEPRLAPR